METYMMITQINDFLFCPRSIYFHNILRNSVADECYTQEPQQIGRAVHKTIDEGTYSTRKNVLTGTAVYCERYGLMGRIDIFNTDTGKLVERKNAVSAIWPGFRFQLYAQYFALCEMGYEVREMWIHSQKDNKSYAIPLPDEEAAAAFEKVLLQMRSFSMTDHFEANPKKCAKCIYNMICDACIEDMLP